MHTLLFAILTIATLFVGLVSYTHYLHRTHHIAIQGLLLTSLVMSLIGGSLMLNGFFSALLSFNGDGGLGPLLFISISAALMFWIDQKMLNRRSTEPTRLSRE